MSELEAIARRAREIAKWAAGQQAWEYDHATVAAYTAVERAFNGFADELLAARVESPETTGPDLR